MNSVFNFIVVVDFSSQNNNFEYRQFGNLFDGRNDSRNNHRVTGRRFSSFRISECVIITSGIPPGRDVSIHLGFALV